MLKESPPVVASVIPAQQTKENKITIEIAIENRKQKANKLLGQASVRAVVVARRRGRSQIRCSRAEKWLLVAVTSICNPLFP